MTRIIDDQVIVIELEDDRKCELCGAVAECRPYGPKGEQICFTCGEKDPKTTERMMGKRFNPVFDNALFPRSKN